MKENHIANMQELVGLTIKAITVGVANETGDVLSVLFDFGYRGHVKMYHDQDCCEHVRLVDQCGEWDNIIGSPLLLAEETSSRVADPDHPCDESFTWSFYRFGTVKGYVTLRWLGESNGYYGESVQMRWVMV